MKLSRWGIQLWNIFKTQGHMTLYNVFLPCFKMTNIKTSRPFCHKLSRAIHVVKYYTNLTFNALVLSFFLRYLLKSKKYKTQNTIKTQWSLTKYPPWKKLKSKCTSKKTCLGGWVVNKLPLKSVLKIKISNIFSPINFLILKAKSKYLRFKI